MVNTLDKILNQNLEPMRNWSTYKDITRIGLRKKIRILLQLLSGDEMLLMLKEVLFDNEKEYFCSNLYDALSNLSFIYQSRKQIRRYSIASALKNARLSLEKSRSLGYNISKGLWTSCSKLTVEKKLGLFLNFIKK